jgi:hypothetical protein
MFSSHARGAEHNRIFPKNGRSFSRAGWPLRGRNVIPGRATFRVPEEMMKTEPSAQHQSLNIKKLQIPFIKLQKVDFTSLHKALMSRKLTSVLE